MYPLIGKVNYTSTQIRFYFTMSINLGNMLGVRNPEHGMDPRLEPKYWEIFEDPCVLTRFCNKNSRFIWFKLRFVIKSMRHLNQEHGSMVRIQVLSSYSVLVKNEILILKTFYYFKKTAELNGQFNPQVPLRPPMVFLFDPALCEKVVLLLLFLLLIFFVIEKNSSCFDTLAGLQINWTSTGQTRLWLAQFRPGDWKIKD